MKKRPITFLGTLEWRNLFQPRNKVSNYEKLTQLKQCLFFDSTTFKAFDLKLSSLREEELGQKYLAGSIQ